VKHGCNRLPVGVRHHPLKPRSAPYPTVVIDRPRPFTRIKRAVDAYQVPLQVYTRIGSPRTARRNSGHGDARAVTPHLMGRAMCPWHPFAKPPLSHQKEPPAECS
jgi:hypothetical protein